MAVATCAILRSPPARYQDAQLLGVVREIDSREVRPEKVHVDETVGVCKVQEVAVKILGVDVRVQKIEARATLNLQM